MKKLVFSAAIILIALQPLFSLTLQQAIKEGLKNNPDLRVSFWKTRSLLEQEKSSSAGTSTMIMLGLNNLPTTIKDSIFNDDMMTQIKIGLKQKIFFPGKLSFKRKIARQLRYISEANHISKKRRIKALIKEIYFRILYLEKIIQLSKHNASLLIQFKKIAQTRYAVGTGLLQDMAKADFEAARLKETIINLNNQRKIAVINFNRLLGRPTTAHLKKLSPVSNKIKKITLAQIHNNILTQATAIKIATHSLKKTKWKKKLAQRMRWPDLTIGTSYGLRTKNNTANLFSINLEFSIPIFTRHRKKIDALEKKILSQRSALIATKKNMLKTATTLFTEINTKRKLLNLYNKKIIPLAKLSVRSALSAYQVGKLEFISLITAQLLLYRYQIINENNIRSYLTLFAHLEFLTGQNLTQGEN